MQLNRIPLHVVHAFTDKRFSGNPAAACPLNDWPDDELLQAIAAENNLSETAFFVNEGEYYRLRWFTPRVEVNLCGHATLASAHVIFNDPEVEQDTVVFEMRSGRLTVRRESDLMILDFPAHKPVRVMSTDRLIKSLGQKPHTIMAGGEFYLTVFDDEATVANLKPDFKLMETLDKGVIATAKGSAQLDFVSRCFVPNVGIPEDPVTGSAHCALVPYWSEKLTKKKFHARQISKRGGDLFCKYEENRVHIGGKAVTYSTGHILLD